MGPNFRTENLPLTTQLFQHVYQDGNAATLAAKNFFKRTRPFVVDPEIKIIVVQALRYLLDGKAPTSYGVGPGSAPRGSHQKSSTAAQSSA